MNYKYNDILINKALSYLKLEKYSKEKSIYNKINRIYKNLNNNKYDVEKYVDIVVNLYDENKDNYKSINDLMNFYHISKIFIDNSLTLNKKSHSILIAHSMLYGIIIDVLLNENEIKYYSDIFTSIEI